MGRSALAVSRVGELILVSTQVIFGYISGTYVCMGLLSHPDTLASRGPKC